MKKFWCNSKKSFCETTINCINCEYYSNLGGAEIEVKEIKTNYDKITSSVESLAEFIEKYATNCIYCPLYKLEKCKLTGWRVESELCKKEIKEWLLKECEG